MRLFTLKLLILTIAFTKVAAQIQVSKTTDGRFLCKNIKGVVSYDPNELMSSFQIGFEWWTLMGEPLEIYEFKWNSINSFRVDGEILNRVALTKYPDLLKRFDALKPSSISVIINGMAEGRGVEVKRGMIPEYSSYLSHYDTYKKDGQSYDKYLLYKEFNRKINSHKLIIEEAGKVGKDLVPGSPSWADYIEFRHRSGNWSNNEERAKVTKHLFKLSSELKQIKAIATEITWPLGEMKSILAKYKEYEKREKMSEEVKVADWSLKDDKKKDSWGDNEDKKKDSWGESSKPKDEWTDINKNKSSANKNAEIFKIEYKDGKYGVVSSAGKILIPFQFDKIEKYDEKYGLAFVSKRTYESNLPVFSCEKGNVNIQTYEEGVVDKFGNFTVPPKKTAKVWISKPYKQPVIILRALPDPNYVYNAERERRIKQENENRERKEQEEMKRCNDKLKESAKNCESVLISRGYTIK